MEHGEILKRQFERYVKERNGKIEEVFVPDSVYFFVSEIISKYKLKTERVKGGYIVSARED